MICVWLGNRTYAITDAELYLPNEESLTNGSRNYTKTPSNDGYDWDCPLCVEFDIQSLENPSHQRFRLYTSTATGTYAFVKDLSSFGISDTSYHHVKVVATETNVKVFVDGNTTPIFDTVQTFDDKVRINFTRITDGSPVTKIKNVAIYPI